MNKEQQYFQDEYLTNHQEPVSMKINGKDYVVPYAYLLQNSDIKIAKENFMDDFFEAQQKDLSLYEKNNLAPKEIHWTDGKNQYTFFVPFALKDKNLSNSEIITAIFKKAEKKYKRAARLSHELSKAYGDNMIYRGVSCLDVHNAQKQYYSYLWSKTKDETQYGALLLTDFARKGIKFGSKGVKFGIKKAVELTPEKIKKLVKRYALVALVGGASLVSGVKTLRSSLSEQKQFNFENVFNLDFEEKNADFALSEKDFSQNDSKKMTPKDIAEHNKQVFVDNINEIKTLLCFMENFASKAFKDGKGVSTIGYGCTYLIDENGRGNREISPIKENMTMTLSEADVQKERYLKYRVLPQVLEDIKSPLDKETLVATTSFMYVIGPKAFKNSEYLKAMNRGVKGEELARYMLGFAKDKGVVKRNWFAAQILTGTIKPATLLNLRAEGCYSLDLEDCCAMNGDKVKRDKNGLGAFRFDNLAENIAKAQKDRESVIGECPPVREILPDYVVQSVSKNAQKNDANIKLAMLQKSKTR